MKSYKFSEELVDLVLNQRKDTTWRLDDERDLEIDETISLQNTGGEEFSRAKVLCYKRTKFGRLSEEDKAGHEDFASKEEMFETYEDYYGKEIDENTELKVVKFKLIQDSK